MESNNLIVKHNYLIQARYKLSLNEQKIILYAISKIDKEQKRLNVLKFEVKEFTSLIGTTEKRYEEIRKIVRSLRNKEIKIHTKDNELITGWLSSIELKKNSGIIELEFSEKLMPYLLQLKEQFTKYQLKNILYLKNKYSIRMYELLKQYEKIGNREFKIQDLKEVIGCEGKYKDFRNFKKFVLDIVTKEINEYTDINISYHKITKGRKTVGIKFIIKYKPDEQDLLVEYLYSNEEIENIKMKSGLNQEEFKDKQIMKLYELSVKKTDNINIDPFEYIRLNYLDMIKRGTAKKKFPYLVKALKEDHAKAEKQLRFKFDLNEDKISELQEQIEKTDNELVKQILKQELNKIINQ